MCCHIAAWGLLAKSVCSWYVDHAKIFADPSPCTGETLWQSCLPLFVPTKLGFLPMLLHHPLWFLLQCTNSEQCTPLAWMPPSHTPTWMVYALSTFLQVVRYAHKTDGIFKSQSSWFSLHTFVSASSNTLLNASTVHFLVDDMGYSSYVVFEVLLSTR